MVIGPGDEMRSSSDEVAHCYKKLNQQCRWISFRVWLDEADNLTWHAIEGGFLEGFGPVVALDLCFKITSLPVRMDSPVWYWLGAGAHERPHPRELVTIREIFAGGPGRSH